MPPGGEMAMTSAKVTEVGLYLDTRRRATKGRSRSRGIVVTVIALTLIAILVLAFGVLKSTPTSPSGRATTLDAAGWTLSTVDSAGLVGWSNSIAVDSSNNVHISYTDGTNHDLKYATNAAVIPEFGTAGMVMVVTVTICIFVALRRASIPMNRA